jgi:hypothetical protein
MAAEEVSIKTCQAISGKGFHECTKEKVWESERMRRLTSPQGGKQMQKKKKTRKRRRRRSLYTPPGLSDSLSLSSLSSL